MDKKNLFKRWRVVGIDDPKEKKFATKNQVIEIKPNKGGGATLEVPPAFCNLNKFHWEGLALSWGSGIEENMLIGDLRTDQLNEHYPVSLHLAKDKKKPSRFLLECEISTPDNQHPRAGSWTGEED